MIYEWKDGTALKLNAQKAGEELEKLRVKNNGQLTPKAIVRAAKKKSSALHDGFEWDDSIAADKYREEQASYILRHIAVRKPVGKDEKPVRAFVSVREEGSQHYTSLEVAMGDDVLRRQVLEKAWRELQAWRQRYEEYQELAQVFAAIDRHQLSA